MNSPPSLAQPLTRRLALREGVTMGLFEGDLTITAAGRTTSITGLPEQVARSLQHLARPDGISPEPDASLPGEGGIFEALLRRLGHLTLVRIQAGPQEVMRHETTVRHAAYEPARLQPDDLLRLDRFALLRSRADTLVLECPRSPHRFVLTSALARELAADLGVPSRVVDLTTRAGGSGVVAAVLSDWVGAGLVERTRPEAAFATDADPVLVQWDFHDLLMHSRSRSGRFDEPLGALSPYRDRIAPLPAVTPSRPDAQRVVDLRAPGLAPPIGLEPTLTDVLQDYPDTYAAEFDNWNQWEHVEFDHPRGVLDPDCRLCVLLARHKGVNLQEPEPA